MLLVPFVCSDQMPCPRDTGDEIVLIALGSNIMAQIRNGARIFTVLKLRPSLGLR